MPPKTTTFDAEPLDKELRDLHIQLVAGLGGAEQAGARRRPYWDSSFGMDSDPFAVLAAELLEEQRNEVAGEADVDDGGSPWSWESRVEGAAESRFSAQETAE